MAKPDTSLIKQTLNMGEKKTNQIKQPTPIIKMLQQVTDMKLLIDININSIEPEASYLEGLQPSRRRPEYWNNLEDEVNTVIAFTDGSCLGNPGPCGAGACIYFNDQKRVELSQPVAKSASILVGELVAIKMTLQCIIDEAKKKQLQNVRILTDSQTSAGILTLGGSVSSHKSLISEIQNLLQSDIQGNEVADMLAKKAAKEAELLDEDLMTA
ncbi:RNH-like protein, partial [Mya arenaria]